MNKVHYCIRDDQMLNDNNYITIKILSINRVKEVMQLYFHWVSLIDLTFHIFGITSCCINLIKMLIKWVMDIYVNQKLDSLDSSSLTGLLRATAENLMLNW